MKKQRYSLNSVSLWAKYYSRVLSVAEVAKHFNISASTINRNFLKYGNQLDIKLKDEIQNELFNIGKRICLPLSGCGLTKSLSDFVYRNDSKKYSEQCKSCKSKYIKKWLTNNRERHLNTMHIYGKTHRKFISEHEKCRKKTDMAFRLIKNLRARLKNAIKHNLKRGSAIADLGCTVEELKDYLSTKFYIRYNGEIMSWDNYGFRGWHIDHIIPLSKFDLSNEQQVKLACHYTNLQPLWAEDNLKKSNQ